MPIKNEDALRHLDEYFKAQSRLGKFKVRIDPEKNMWSVANAENITLLWVPRYALGETIDFLHGNRPLKMEH